MSRAVDRPLTQRQSGLVVRHLPLVFYQLRRQLSRAGPRSRQFDDDLVQEGCLALAEAVREHRADRHGPFGPFAVTRIHRAMSVFLRERKHLIRVPLTTQRRRAHAARDRHAPDAPPREPKRLRRSGQIPRLDPASRPPPTVSTRTTVGELMRPRIEAAIAAARDDVIRVARRRAGAARLVDELIRERLSIPEPAAQTPIRELLKRLKVSHGRLTHTAVRLARRTARRLRRDPAFRYLRMLARRMENGIDHRPSAEQLLRLERARKLGKLSATGRAAAATAAVADCTLPAVRP